MYFSTLLVPLYLVGAKQVRIAQCMYFTDEESMLNELLVIERGLKDVVAASGLAHFQPACTVVQCQAPRHIGFTVRISAPVAVRHPP